MVVVGEAALVRANTWKRKNKKLREKFYLGDLFRGCYQSIGLLPFCYTLSRYMLADGLAAFNAHRIFQAEDAAILLVGEEFCVAAPVNDSF